MPRVKRPPSPSSGVGGGHDGPAPKGKKSKDQAKVEPPPMEAELNENGEPREPPPKTFTLCENFDYRRPCLYVEQDHPDKGETVTECYVRGFKLDFLMQSILHQCWSSMTSRLHTIHIWNAGISPETLKSLAHGLTQCEHIKTLDLDNNPVPGEEYDIFIGPESHLQHLSLRFCRITDQGAKRLGETLGNVQRRNEKLLTLNLSGNFISDEGATSLAKGLRTNRTLFSLTLSGNLVGDVGATKLAESLSRFSLSHEEILQRRKLISERAAMERSASGSPNRRGDGKDRPGSVRNEKSNKRDKSSKVKGKDTKDEKAGNSKGGKKEKEDSRAAKGKSNTPSDNSKSQGKSKSGKAKERGKEKGKDETESQADQLEQLNPLMDRSAESINGEVWLPGNRVVINLNLSRNKIGMEGIKNFLLAVQYQITLSSNAKQHESGLMRFQGQKNVPEDCEYYQKLCALLNTRDPFYKPENLD